MYFIDRLKNHKLRIKEKFGNSCYRQLMRLAKMLANMPLRSVNNGILKVMIGLTYKCQCSCNYCCAGLYSKETEKELTSKELKNLIYDISQLPSLCTLVSFFGGEPLLKEDIFYLIEVATKGGLFTEMETNGILLSLENVKRLKKAGLHHIFIRIENSNPKLHNEISNFDGCFENATEGVRYCVAEKLSCSISTIATREKIYNDEIKRIISLGKKLGVTSVRILYPTLSGKWLNESNVLITSEEKNKIKELLRPDFVYLESTYTCTNEAIRFCPSMKKKLFYISCYGEVQPCPFVPLSFGNIRNEKINEILGKMWQNKIFKDVEYEDCLMNEIKFRDKYINSLESNEKIPVTIRK